MGEDFGEQAAFAKEDAVGMADYGALKNVAPMVWAKFIEAVCEPGIFTAKSTK